LKNQSNNIIYIILNLLYIIPGLFFVLITLDTSNIIPIESYEMMGVLIILYLIFLFMKVSFTILIHPLVQIIILFSTWKNKKISKVYIIIIFILSIIITIFVYKYI